MIDQNGVSQKGKVDLFDVYALDLVDFVTALDAKVRFCSRVRFQRMCSIDVTVRFELLFQK